MVGDNGPKPDWWEPECHCRVCHDCLPPLAVPPTIELGEN